jgi:hypothetical protein
VERRVEHKYLVPERLRPQLRRVVQPFVHPDAHATPHASLDGYAGYTVRSAYYDTSTFTHYFANEAGLPVRAKPRIRGYDDETTEAVVFLEVKRRHHAVGSKQRAPVPFAQVHELLASGDVEAHVRESRSCPSAIADAGQFLHLVRRDALRPVVSVVYEREAYVGSVESSLRITFDGHIRAIAFPALADLYRDGSDRRVLRGHFVLEVKHDARLGFPVWLRPFLSTHGVVRQALSKYARSMFDLGIVRPHTKTLTLARADWRGSGFDRAVPLKRAEGMTWIR